MIADNGAVSVEDIARICHAANSAIQSVLGEVESRPWEYCESWMQRVVIHGVQWRLANPEATIAAQHERWMADKIEAGWCHGPVKDETRKQHPNIKPFEDLPAGQRLKDRVFVAIVKALAPSVIAAENGVTEPT